MLENLNLGLASTRISSELVALEANGINYWFCQQRRNWPKEVLLNNSADNTGFVSKTTLSSAFGGALISTLIYHTPS